LKTKRIIREDLIINIYPFGESEEGKILVSIPPIANTAD